MNKWIKVLVFFFLCSIYTIEVMAAQICKPNSITASTPNTDFLNKSNGTVLHVKTSLVWKRCLEGQTWTGGGCFGAPTRFSWQGALQHAASLNAGAGFAGFHDWHVPNIKELSSIVEVQCYNPAINLTIFPSVYQSSNGIWSSSQDQLQFIGNALYLSFIQGFPYNTNKTNLIPVLLVRGGQ